MPAVSTGSLSTDSLSMDSWPTGRLLSTAARLVEHFWNEKLAAVGLTHAGVVVLEVLSATGEPMSQSMIAQRVCVQDQTMGKTLSRLVARGYIRRQASASDRRSQAVSMTGLGARVLKESREGDPTVSIPAAVDEEKLRTELQNIIRTIAPQTG